ncbi:MAG: flagellin, partial [Phycisphaerae bacterium]
QMENSVSNAFDVASGARTLVINALNLDNASLLSLPQRSKDMILELGGLLNAKQGDRHLFAGARIDQEPIDVSVLLSTDPPLIDAAEFTGTATIGGTGITGITGISKVRVESGNTDDAFQLTYDAPTKKFTLTNLNGGASGTAALGTGAAPGQTLDLTFTVGGEKVVLTLDDKFNSLAPIVNAPIAGVVDTAGFGVGAFGAISVSATAGDVSKIDRNIIETSGTAASATLTLSSTDGDFVASGVDLSVGSLLVPVVLTNATTGASMTLQVNLTTGLNDAAIASNQTEIQLGDFLRNIAATNGTISPASVRPSDAGYDPANPSFYKGDKSQILARIDVNATVDYGVNAAEPGFEKLFRALDMIMTANVTPGSTDTNTLETALGLINESITDIPDIRSRIGSDRQAIDRAKSRHEDFMLFTRESISNIEDVDVAAAVARIGVEQTQLEASFLLTSRLSRLSLANFLR